jgi:hypothetical protein
MVAVAGIMSAALCFPADHGVRISATSRRPKMEDSERLEATQDSQAVHEEKFAPRFDGLRFIKTLVTAHR